MQRIPSIPRPAWQRLVEQQGLTFHTPADVAMDRPYWDESAFYQFTPEEIDTLEAAANELQTMCLAAAQHVIDTDRFADLGIPPVAIPVIKTAWNAEPPALYGRFDLLWGGAGSGTSPKLLEYNADTPTSLLETAVIQWHWLEDVARSEATATLPNSRFDQFNSLHEKLIAKWKDIAPYLQQPVYFAGVDSDEDALTLAYLQDTAHQAGLATNSIAMLDVGWNADRQCFVDLAEQQIHTLFKLYPWETLLNEAFAPHALATYGRVTWIEPIWKLLLSNKGLLPILWELYPDHPFLLEAHFSAPAHLVAHVRKPLFSREGANLTLTEADGTVISTDGPYGDGRSIVQARGPEVSFPDHLTFGARRHPVLGLWMVDQTCAGMGIRESAGPITDNLSSFVPHLFRS